MGILGMFPVPSMLDYALDLQVDAYGRQIPLDRDVSKSQVYPVQDFNTSPRQNNSRFTGTQRASVVRRIFGQWMQADVYPLVGAYVPFGYSN